MPPPARRRTSVEVVIDGRRLELSNLDKVLYPAVGYTKGQVIEYFMRIAPALLPHLKGRPLTLKRYPNGVEGKFFYEKNCPRHRPDWVRTAPLWSRHSQRMIDYCLVEDLPTLIWVVNLAAFELHASLSLAEEIERPSALVFDLDPGAPATALECAEVALELRELLNGLGLQSAIKSSGSKGLQLYVPLNGPTSYEQTKPFAHALAELLERRRPELVVSRMTKALRAGKVLVDWSQNDASKTTVSVYSLRARPRPTVSAPLAWEEVETAFEQRASDGLLFGPEQVIERVAADGDHFDCLLDLGQELPSLDRADVARPKSS